MDYILNITFYNQIKVKNAFAMTLTQQANNNLIKIKLFYTK